MNETDQVAEAIATHGRPLWVSYIPYQTRHQVSTKVIGELLATAHRSPDSVTRADLYGDLKAWCASNVYAEVTVPMLATISGLSKPSVRKFIDDHGDMFKKVEKRSWEVRNPKSDRALDKK
tara:strand:- start:1141 stop:1503 length:363 start_codon:yes stop_codon:yes gene_type:complete